jgi:3-isopropylmalate dehydrogenase
MMLRALAQEEERVDYRIAVIGGDGIGPEVVREGVKVLRALASEHGFGVALTEYPFGAEHYLRSGELFPDSALAEVRDHHAVLLGAIGDPRIEVGKLEYAIVAGLRFGLDLYVNLRPVVLYTEKLTPLKNRTPADIDFVVVRENTEDVYTGIGGIFKKGTQDEVATQQMIFTRRGTERIIRYAFDLTRARAKKKKLLMVDKANAIRAQDLWTRTFAEVGREYPDVAQEHAYVDACCMFMVKSPEAFDVVVTTNMFGDIITDLGAEITGGMGIAASGNIHPGRVSMFEPIHGSAPKYAGQNVASPVATILAVQMMLDYLGEKTAATRLDESLRACLTDGRIPSVDARSGLSTSAVGDVVVDAVRKASVVR